MAFEISSVAVKDGAGASVGGGILAADVAGGGVGPFFFFHGLVDGVAGVNKVQIDASNRMAVLADLGATDNAVLDAIAASLATLDNVVAGNEAQVDVLTIAAGDNNIGNVDIVTVPADPFGANADAASATTSISAKLRAIATALGTTALDLGTGTGGSRTLRFANDTAQWVGGSGVNGTAVQRVTVATDDTLVTSLATKLDTLDASIGDGTITQVAHGAADSGGGFPIKFGFKAVSGLSAETPVDADDRSNVLGSKDGSMYVRNIPLEDLVADYASNTDGTTTEVLAAAGAGIKQYLTHISFSNTGAGVVVDVESVSLDSPPVATVKWSGYVPTGGREVVLNDGPIPPAGFNEKWNFNPASATTTVICSMVGFKSKV